MGDAAAGRSLIADERAGAVDIAPLDASFGRALQLLDGIVGGDGALPAAEKHLMAVAGAAVRDPARCAVSVERAVGCGATSTQLGGVALAVYLSRGAAPARCVLAAATSAGATVPTSGGAHPTDHHHRLDTDRILAEFRAVFGEVPDRVRLLAEHAPDALEAYHRMRVAVLREGALPPRLAELVLFGVNAAEHRGDYATVHARGARRAGASEAELVEAGVVAIEFGGVAAWLAASEAIVATRSEN